MELIQGRFTLFKKIRVWNFIIIISSGDTEARERWYSEGSSDCFTNFPIFALPLVVSVAVCINYHRKNITLSRKRLSGVIKLSLKAIVLSMKHFQSLQYIKVHSKENFSPPEYTQRLPNQDLFFKYIFLNLLNMPDLNKHQVLQLHVILWFCTLFHF